jgi:truncated hemoglobin YjbI
VLRRVVNNGARFADEGLHAEIYYLYGGALLSIEPFLDHRPELQKAIQKALADAQRHTNGEARARTLRNVIDQIRSEVESPEPGPANSLWQRLGGKRNVKKIVSYFIDKAIADPKVNFSRNGQYKLTPEKVADIKRKMVLLTSWMTGGPDGYEGKSMAEVHHGMGITDEEYTAMLRHLPAALTRNNVSGRDAKKVEEILEFARTRIVGQSGPVTVGKSGPASVGRQTLWDRLGGEEKVKAIVNDVIDKAKDDPKVNFSRSGKYPMTPEKVADIKRKMVHLTSMAAGGPYRYEGKSMTDAHEGMGITDAEYGAFIRHMEKAMLHHGVNPNDVAEIVKVLEAIKVKFIEKKTDTSLRSGFNVPRQQEGPAPFGARRVTADTPSRTDPTPWRRPAVPLVRAPASELFALVPADADLLARVELRQVVDSPLFTKYVLDHCKTALRDTEPRKLLANAGLDPLRDLDSVTLSVADMMNPRFMLVVRGRFEQGKVADLLEAEARKANYLAVSKEGPCTIYEAGNTSDRVYGALPGPGVLVISNRKDHLLQALRSTGPPRLHPDLPAAVDRVNGKACVWATAVVTEEMKNQMKKNPQAEQYAEKLKALTASLNVTDDVHLNVQIHTSDARAAMQVQEVVEALKPFLTVLGAGNEQAARLIKELVDNIMIGTDNPTVTIDLEVSGDQLEKFVKAGQK